VLVEVDLEVEQMEQTWGLWVKEAALGVGIVAQASLRTMSHIIVRPGVDMHIIIIFLAGVTLADMVEEKVYQRMIRMQIVVEKTIGGHGLEH
jgi:hypothetical protein